MSVAAKDSEPQAGPDDGNRPSADLESVHVGIRHLERLYLELGSLRVQLEEKSPLTAARTDNGRVEGGDSAE